MDLPSETGWQQAMMNIVAANWDEREPVKVRLAGPDGLGQPIGPASVLLVKGWTRISAVLYILEHAGNAIAKLSADEHPADVTSFRECLGRAESCRHRHVIIATIAATAAAAALSTKW